MVAAIFNYSIDLKQQLNSVWCGGWDSNPHHCGDVKNIIHPFFENVQQSLNIEDYRDKIEGNLLHFGHEMLAFLFLPHFPSHYNVSNLFSCKLPLFSMVIFATKPKNHKKTKQNV